MSFSKAHRLQFLVGVPVSSLPSLVNGFSLLNKCNFSSVKLNSWTVPMYHIPRNMLHMISSWCVANDLHIIVPRHLSVRVGDSSRYSEEIVQNLELCLSTQWGDCTKSWIVPFNTVRRLYKIFLIVPFNIITIMHRCFHEVNDHVQISLMSRMCGCLSVIKDHPVEISFFNRMCGCLCNQESPSGDKFF